jgi:hypothetical protein
MGRSFVDLLNPTPEQINLDDMITNLDRTYRWKGAVPFTVNQHETLVMLIIRRWGGNWQTQFEGLIHDGHEYITGDIPTPFKDGLWFKAKDGSLNRVADVQERLQKAIRAKLGFKPEDIAAVDFELVRKADRLALETEYGYWFSDKPNGEYIDEARWARNIIENLYFDRALHNWRYHLSKFSAHLSPMGD